LALYWQRQEDPAQAVGYFTQLADQYPAEVLWQIEAGKAMAQAGDIPAGLQLLVNASLAFPQSVTVWTELANFCATYRIELQTYGLTAARSALRLTPDDPAARLAMGNVLFALDDLESAARYYQQVLDARPNDSNALYQMALLAVQQERLPDARYYFNRVLTTTPTYAELHILAQRSLEAIRNRK
jgi:tetratricopeptide (TPR) repeat protein